MRSDSRCVATPTTGRCHWARTAGSRLSLPACVCGLVCVRGTRDGAAFSVSSKCSQRCAVQLWHTNPVRVHFPSAVPLSCSLSATFFPSATSFILDAVNVGGWLRSIQCLVCHAAIYALNTVISHRIICHKAPFQLWNPKSLSWCKAHPKGMNGLTEAIGMEIFVQSPTPKASLCQHKCQCMYSYWAWLTELSPSPQWAKCIACCIVICHSPGLFDSVCRPRKEEDLVREARHLLTRKKPACTQIPPVF